MKMKGRFICFSMFVIMISTAMLLHSQENRFPLKNGDTWVMAGDSITAQHLHSNYFEAFCHARFPKLDIRFRNSGVGGDTITKTIARFERDIGIWSPTIVSVELGMNDSGAGPDSTSDYISNMNILVERIIKSGARPVLFTSSPVNDGTPGKSLKGRNFTIDLYSSALGGFSAARKIPFANQFHTLIDIWAANKPLEKVVAFAEEAVNILSLQDLPGRQSIEEWLKTWNESDMNKKSANLGGNPVHPGPVGQLMMSSVLLKELGATGFVSSASVDFSGKILDTTGCLVSNVKVENGGISFDRLDESLPMPIPDEGRSALNIFPLIEELSQWILSIHSMPEGVYDVFIDGIKTASISSGDLGKGWNMGLLEKGPVADQCRQILNLVSVKEKLVSDARAKSKALFSPGMSVAEVKMLIEDITKKVDEADKEIRAVAKPRIHRFSIVPAQP